MITSGPSGQARGHEAAPPRRLTPGARRVLGALSEQQAPVTAQQLHAQLRSRGSRIGLTTVYRALRALADSGLVHEFRLHEETSFRACSRTEHIHLICARCGGVQEHGITELEDALVHVQEEGFRIFSSRIEIHGLCGQCDPTASAVT